MNPTKHFKRALRKNMRHLVKWRWVRKRKAGPVLSPFLSAYINTAHVVVESPFSFALGPSTIPGARFCGRGE